MDRILKKGFQFSLMMAVLAVPQAYGGVISYTNLATWQAASPGATTIDFEGIAASGGFTYESPSFSLSGVTFGANAGANLFVISSTYSGTSYNIGTGDILNVQQGPPNVLTITLPANTFAFGFDYGDAEADDSFALAVALSTGDNFNLTMSPSAQFFGITSTTAVSSLTLTTSATFDAIDNFRFGTGSGVTVPEPSSWLLVGVGVLALAWKRVRGASINKA